MADTFTRLSPGVWRNNKTGATVKSANDPGKAAAKPARTPTAGAALNGATGATVAGNVQGQLDLSKGATDAAGNLIGAIPKEAYNIRQFDNLLPTYDQGSYDTAFNAALANATKGLDAKEEKDRAAYEQKLAERGIPLGSDLYTQQFKELGQTYEDYRVDGRNQAQVSAQGIANDKFNVQKAAYDSTVGAYNNSFGKPIEFANSLTGISSGALQLAQQDKQFQEEVKQFGQGVALEKWKVRQALASKGGGGKSGSGAGSSTTPIDGGNAF